MTKRNKKVEDVAFEFPPKEEFEEPKQESGLAIQHQALPVSPDKIKTIIEQNLGGSADMLGLSALERIKIPPAGTSVWEIPSPLGDGNVYLPALNAVICKAKQQRVYWEGTFTGENRPPDCYSIDMVKGSQFGKCSTCNFSKWGSALQGAGQACRSINVLGLLLLSEDQKLISGLPYILILPPTSLKNFARYAGITLAGRGLYLYDVITRLTLGKEKNQTGITYSVAKFEVTGSTPIEVRDLAIGLGKLVEHMASRPPTMDEMPIISNGKEEE